ncbi:ABC transporter permease [Cellulomonas fengjieae]|uniref:ABC transporter permease n=1 Tax=Cellulomonas fengjieae TaxID=2819978 RepID=UPI001AAE70B9|nr:ABC transporter permease subunit [Cellulomonas fengjieae]MBO3102131.1 ABC transporter permease [Cellulomonas fengjieae]
MTLSEVALEPEQPTTPPRAPRSATWGLTWHGVRTVAVLELRQRVRSTRWIVALVVWFVVVGGITLLTSGALAMLGSGPSDGRASTGPLLFGAVTFLVLGLGLLVTPTLASTGINGDRNAGTLATLQVTLLTPAEIAAGKLLAAWAAACAFLVASLPFLGIAMALGGTPGTALPRVVLLIAILLASVCGIGLGFSALTARTAGSTVLTFLTVAALTLLTPVLFGLTYPSISRTQDVPVNSVPSDWDGQADPECEVTVQERTVPHTERTWWLLGINPFVVLSDGAGTAEGTRITGRDNDPLALIRTGVRELRAGPTLPLDECWVGQSDPPAEPDTVSGAPVWPWGLAVNVLLGAAGYVVAVRRLRIPQRTLARGTRVA